MALAVDKQCSRLPCFGTDGRDTLYERGGDGVPDDIRGLRYGDRQDKVNGGYGYDECLVDRPVEVGSGCDVVGYAIE